MISVAEAGGPCAAGQPEDGLHAVRLPGEVSRLPARPGTYALILQCRRQATVAVGRWGELDLTRGWYLYVGSALGAGGLRARLGRHARRDKRRHWHIDYLAPRALPTMAWYYVSPRRWEHTWAAAVAAADGFQAVRDFGCSDCRCTSHLFYSAWRPELTRLSLEELQSPGAGA